MKQHLPKRSPIKRPPLPQAGESLRNKLGDVVTWQLLFWSMRAVFAGYVAGNEWWRLYLHLPLQPVFLTICAIPVVTFALLKIRRGLVQARCIRLGLAGERLVGECLEAMRAHGYKVFHDLPGNGFNVDHALIGPAGVFVIETKTISKPLRGDVRVTYDGARVLIDGHRPDRDPVVQANAAADYVRELLASQDVQRLPVRPVVLYPGWYVERLPRGAAVWVLNEKALPSFIMQEDVALSTAEVERLASALEQSIRSKQ